MYIGQTAGESALSKQNTTAKSLKYIDPVDFNCDGLCDKLIKYHSYHGKPRNLVQPTAVLS